MQIFKNKWFSKFTKEEGILDEELCEAVRDAERGLINIKTDEVRWFKKMAKSTFELSEDQLEKLIKTGDFRPVKCNE